MIETKAIIRKFIYNGTELPDPNPAATIEGVRDILASTHAEIATAAIDGPDIKGEVHTYTFVRSVGTKG
jgi:PRTRC genetic system protein C